MLRVNVTIPVFNEELELADSIETLETFLGNESRFRYEVVIADNGSTDHTLRVASDLTQRYSNLSVAHLDEKGRGGALKNVWIESGADILSYMDVDLSTDLHAFPLLIEALASGDFEIAIGSRLHREAHTERRWWRDWISRGYNRLIKWLCATRFSDAQCGFKAITREAAGELLPFVEDQGWFFDTELLVVAERCGYRIEEVPVVWVDDPGSHVMVLPTAWRDFTGLLRVRRNLKRGRYEPLTKGIRVEGQSQLDDLAKKSA